MVKLEKKNEGNRMKKKNRFRCQYQKGDEICESEPLESDSPITYEQVLVALASLAVKIGYLYGDKPGGEVALKVLEIHERVILDMYPNQHCGDGKSKSYYFNLQDKNKIERSERVDIQFWGEFEGGKPSHPLHHYIELYRKSKGK